MLNGIIYAHEETHRLIGYKDVRSDEFGLPAIFPAGRSFRAYS